MNAVQPLFFINIVIGLTLALCVAFIAFRRERDLTIWASAFALYPIAFFFFGFRSYFPEPFVVIVANTCLSLMFALFSEGLVRLFGLRLHRLWIWGLFPVAVAGYVLLYDDFETRNTLGAFLTCYHAVVAIFIVSKGLLSTQGRGRWIIFVAVLGSSLTFLVRGAMMALGITPSMNYLQPGTAQTILFSLAVMSLTMFTIGILVKYKERAEREMLRLALHDPLTQLGNRRVLHERLLHAFRDCREQGHFSAFMVLDLDEFKELNDTHGHALGDQLLVEVAYRLKDCVNDTDTVIRLGGDEFVLLLVGLDTEEEKARQKAQSIASRVRDKLREPYTLHPLNVPEGESPRVHYTLSVSIGADLFDGQSKDRETLFKNADDAMYQAKQSGRNRAVFHGDGLAA